MRTRSDDQEDAPATTIMPVEMPTSPTEQEPSEHLRRLDMSPEPPRRRPFVGRTPLTALGVVTLLALTLALLFADGGQTTASQARITPTAKPTATATATPSPTAAPGFNLYTDQSEGFLIQYPHAWTRSDVRPGIQFVDDKTNLGFVVDVIVLDDTSSAPQGVDPQDGSVWVDHVMRDYASQFQDQFEELPGPIPDAHFGGATWQSGVALLGSDSSRVRVQVYATVHEDKPYVVAVFAADDIFTFGSSQYFEPMLHSFRFLPPAS